jgi:hypothetical protein
VSISTITVGGESVTLVSLPTAPERRLVEWNFSDAVAAVESTFTGQVQTQEWPGADMLGGTMTMPSLTQPQADDWISFLMQCRGRRNAFLIGDPLKTSPRGSVAGTPLIDNTVTSGNAAMSQTLGIKGFTASAAGVLLRGDWIQFGFRFHRVLDDVDADGSGKATIPIWPSIREVPTDGGAIVTTNPKGLFRLANNQRTWSADVKRLTQLSFQIQEYR